MAAALPRIKHCPHCGDGLWFYYGSDPSLIQWTFWTDGHDTEVFDSLRGGQLRRCSLCHRYFVEDAIRGDDALENLMQLLAEPTAVEPAEAKGDAEKVEAEDFYRGISAVGKSLSKAQELSLRIDAWRLENHRVRALRWKGDHLLKDAEIYFSAAAVDSMRRMFDLLGDESETRRFYRGEIARELGAFEAAAALFDDSNFVELRPYSTRARRLALGRDRYVANFR